MCYRPYNTPECAVHSHLQRFFQLGSDYVTLFVDIGSMTVSVFETGKKTMDITMEASGQQKR